MNKKLELYEKASELNIKIENAKEKSDGFKIAIHLLNPTFEELENAIYDAESKFYDTIVIHSLRTWVYDSKREKFEVQQKLLA